MNNGVCGRCSVSQIIYSTIDDVYFKKGNVFHHLKLEIVLPIIASYERKMNKQFSSINLMLPDLDYFFKAT